MKKKQFDKIMLSAMKRIDTDMIEFSCTAIRNSGNSQHIASLVQEYHNVFGTWLEGNREYYLFVVSNREDFHPSWDSKTTRLNMLAMFWAQSISFKSYKEY